MAQKYKYLVKYIPHYNIKKTIDECAKLGWRFKSMTPMTPTMGELCLIFEMKDDK